MYVCLLYVCMYVSLCVYAVTGFLNPLIYAHPEVFTDIVEGSNPGCNTDGFPAAPGWDPVTGFGSPNYPKLAALVQQLP